MPTKPEYRVEYADLREWLEKVNELGELQTIKGADWNEEMGGITEVLYREKAEKAPMLLFDNFPGYPSGYRCIIGATGLFDGIQQGQGGRIGVQVKCTRIGTEGFLMGLFGGCGHRVAGGIFGTRGEDAFGIFPGNFDKGVVFDTVVGDEYGFHSFLTHLSNNF